jgi:hypothetical protein
MKTKQVRITVICKGKPFASFGAPEAVVAAWDNDAKDRGITRGEAFNDWLRTAGDRVASLRKSAAVRARLRGLRSRVRILQKALRVAQSDIERLDAA